jgi:hypothetical protein
MLSDAKERKAAGEKVFCDTLVDKHFFDGQHYLDTVTINSY